MTPRPGATASEVLAALAGLPALVRACVFEIETGTVRGATGSDGHPAPSLLAWARHARDVSVQRGHALEDVIISSTDAHHLLREFPTAGASALWVHVEVDVRHGNLALARRHLARATLGRVASRTGSAPVPQAPRPTIPAARTPAPVVPALTMLSTLDDEQAPVVPAPRAPVLAAALAAGGTVVEPRVEAMAEVPAPARTAPRRVPLMGRPPIAFVEPPTVPPPPLPGAEPDVAVVIVEPAAAPADETPVDDTPAAPTAPGLPTRTPGEHIPAVAAHRAPERPSGWGTDGGTLRRLLVGLRRLA